MSRSSPRRAYVADPVLGDERGRDVVLGRERVGRREHDLRAARLERPHQVGGLGRDVEARADAQAVERPVALEPLADEAQDGHLALGPFDAADAFGREAEVGDVVGGQASWRRSSGVGLLAGEQAAQRRRDVGPGRAEAVDEALLEAGVLGVAEPAIGVEGRRVVGPDVEDDLVARAQQLRGHGAGDGGREAASTIVEMGQDVADDRQARGRADDVGPAADTSRPLTRIP